MIHEAKVTTPLPASAAEKLYVVSSTYDGGRTKWPCRWAGGAVAEGQDCLLAIVEGAEPWAIELPTTTGLAGGDLIGSYPSPLVGPPFVTSLPLPADSVDRQEVRYLPPGSGHPVQPVWHMKYRAATGKWHFLGGSPVDIVAGGGGYNNLGGGFQYFIVGNYNWTVPYSGSYWVHQTVELSQTSTAGTPTISVGAIHQDAANNPIGGTGVQTGSGPVPQNITTEIGGRRRMFLVDLTGGATRKFGGYYWAPGFLLNGIVQFSELLITPDYMSVP